jgi:hypothetical protein
MYQGARFAKKIGSAVRGLPSLPPPLSWVPCSAERGQGLPSTRSQLALPVAPATHTHQPAPGDTQGNVSRQLAGAVVLGAELRQRAHAVRGALLQFEYLRKLRGALAFRAWPGRPGRDG